MNNTTRPMADEAVSVRDLVIHYGEVTAVDRVSFDAKQGEVTVILGPNGAGKTSTVEHLEGYRRASSGRSAVLGLDPIRDHTALSSRVGVMLQNGGIPMAIRPLEALRQYAGFFDDSVDPHEMLERVGLERQARSTYRKLSGGERQRLSLGLAIIGRPEVVFLDEPSAGVDLAGRDSIISIVAELRDGGSCVIVTTHDLSEAERLADRVVIMDRGRVVADGPIDELLSGGGDGDEVVFSTAAPIDASRMSRALGIRVTSSGAHEYRASSTGSRTVTMARVASWCADNDVDLLELRSGHLRLDDLFRALTRPTADSDSTQLEDVQLTQDARSEAARSEGLP